MSIHDLQIGHVYLWKPDATHRAIRVQVMSINVEKNVVTASEFENGRGKTRFVRPDELAPMATRGKA